MRKQKGLALIIVGCTLLLLGAVSFVVAAGVFTAGGPVPRQLEIVGMVCLFAWWLPGLLGLIGIIWGTIVLVRGEAESKVV